MGPPSDLFLRILYVSRILHGDPLRSVSLHTIVGSLISFSSHTIWGPIRALSSHIILGSLSD